MNWQTTFAKRLSFDLENGLLGSPGDMADAITSYYVQTLLTGNIPGIPPTLPSPAASGAPVPVGPIATINGFSGREKLFNQTLKTYFQAQAALQGRANIQDLVKTSRRLVIKAKNLKRDIKSTSDQLRLVTRELQQLPQTLRELVASLVEYIKDKLSELRQLPSLLTGFRLELGPEEFENAFREELNFIQKLTSFRIGRDIGSYREFGILFTEFGKRINTLQYNFSSQATIKAYIYKKMQTVIVDVLNVVQGFTNPAAVLDIFRDVARLKRRYRRTYNLINFFVSKSARLNQRQATLKVRNKRLQKQLRSEVDPKIQEVKNLIGDRVNSLTNVLARTGQAQVILGVKKTITELNNKYKKKVKKIQTQIKASINLLSQLNRLILKIDAIVQSIGVVYDRITQRAIQLANNSSEQIRLNRTELVNKIRSGLGIVNTGVVSFLTSLALQYSLTIQDVKDLVRTSGQVLVRLYESIKSVFEVDIPNLKKALRGTFGSTKQIRTGPSRKTDLILISEALGKVNREFKELQTAISKKVKRLTGEIQQNVQSLKSYSKTYINNLSEKSPTQNRTKNRIRRLEGDKVETEKKAKDWKKIAQTAYVGGKFSVAASSILSNVANGDILISSGDNEKNIKDMLQNYYLYMKIQNKMSAETANRERFKKEQTLNRLRYIEMLVGLFLQLGQEIASGELIDRMDREVDSLQGELDQNFTNSYQALRNLLKARSAKDLVNGVEGISLQVLNNKSFIQTLYVTEQRYIRKFKQTIKQAQAYQQNSGINENAILRSFYTNALKVNSIILFLLEKIQEGVQELKRFLLEFIRPAQLAIKKQVELQRQKANQRVSEQAKQRVEKKINIDAAAQAVIFNLATRLFWTGFSWTNPVGTTFVVTNLGVFKRIKALSEAGSDGYANELAQNFALQLKQITGTAIPNPATGIPPFPFVGYN